MSINNLFINVVHVRIALTPKHSLHPVISIWDCFCLSGCGRNTVLLLLLLSQEEEEHVESL